MGSAVAPISFHLSPAQKVFEASRVPVAQGVNVEQVVCATSEVLNLAAFQQAWQDTFEQHPGLRVAIKCDDQELYQEVISPLKLLVSVMDHRTVPAMERAAFLENWLEQDRQKGFCLSEPPLMRVTVLCFAEGATTWIWSFHHILLDGRSFFLVLEDFFACYQAACDGSAVSLAERRPFADFIEWQESWLSVHQNVAESFWRGLYKNEEENPHAELNIRKAPSSSADYRQEEMQLKAGDGKTQSLHGLATKLAVSVNTIIQGAWALTLSRHYNSTSVTFTTIRACRRGSIEGTDAMVGVLMNSLPVHASICSKTSVANYLKSINAQQLAARAYQWTPWEIIRNSIPIAASRQMADSCVLYERYGIAEEMSERYGMDGTRKFSFHERPNIPLILSISEKPEIQFDLRFQSSVFAKDDAEQLGQSFLALLDEMLKRPDLTIAELGALKPSSFLSPAQTDRRQRYNDTHTAPVIGLLHAGFFAMSKKQPELIAVNDPARRLNYGELAGYAHSVARRLRTEKIPEGTLVAVIMEKGWEQVAAVLGILRAGAAYLPIDPDLPKERIEYLLTNGRVKIALAQPRLRTAFTWPSGLKVWTVEEEFNPEPAEGPEPNPESLAYVIYTSGSTGQPKGVMISHRAALNTTVDINRRLKITSNDRVLAVSALTFDLSVYDIFGILECGGAVVLPSPDRSRDPVHWIERINQCGVTIWNSAPAVMQMLVTVLETSSDQPPINLRWAMLSGDWIPIDLPDRIRKFAPNCQLLSLGGATEVSIWSIAFPIEQIDPAWTSIPYGMPLTNQTIHVLDERFAPCPEMVAGEIYIGGDGLALGYWGDAAKTAERFVRSALTGEALYRTGDFGRFRPEGYVEFLGRKDTQVKIRGHRIEIGEIETALLRLCGVREGAALTVKDERSNMVLVGCIVADQTTRRFGTDPATEEHALRAQLSEWLPTHMIPSRIIVLDKLPLSSNGKVDRGALQEIVRPALRLLDSNPEDEPSDYLERAIWGIWRDILPSQRIGTRDRFLDLGGDSLSELQMKVRVEKLVGRTIGLHVLRGGGRIVDIAAAARASGPVPPPSLMYCIQPGNSLRPFFFAHGDLSNGGLYCQRLAHEMRPEQPFYAIGPHGTFGEDLPCRFEDVAADYVKLIRSIQPKGPYSIGGYCNGAIAMYEVAQQLIRAGDSVATLVLFDPPDLYFFLTRAKFINAGRRLGLTGRRSRGVLHRIAEIMVSLQYHFNLAFFVSKFRSRLAGWTQSLKNMLASEKTLAPVEMLRLNFHYVELIADYKVRPYAESKSVWVILRREDPKLIAQQTVHWGKVIPEARYESISGDHLELKKSVKEIAQIFEAAVQTPT